MFGVCVCLSDLCVQYFHHFVAEHDVVPRMLLLLPDQLNAFARGAIAAIASAEANVGEGLAASTAAATAPSGTHTAFVLCSCLTHNMYVRVCMCVCRCCGHSCIHAPPRAHGALYGRRRTQSNTARLAAAAHVLRHLALRQPRCVLHAGRPHAARQPVRALQASLCVGLTAADTLTSTDTDSEAQRHSCGVQ